MVGQCCCGRCLSPLGWSVLAWLAACAVDRNHPSAGLGGRHPYRVLWLSSFVFWLATLHWMTLPHWATSFGWVALSCYLACYFPAFIALCRVATHTLRISPLVAAPVVWTGFELARRTS